MANTYTQLYIQFVFAPKYREACIKDEWKHRLYQYIIGTVENHGHKALALNGMPDHIHLFIGLDPKESLSELMRIVKSFSSKWINEQDFLKKKFEWQEGYGAFSYSRSQIDGVVKYIHNQEIYHAKKTFLEEYKKLLDDFKVEYDEKYIFKELI